MPNCPFLLSVPNCPILTLGAKLSGAKLSGAKLSYNLGWDGMVTIGHRSSKKTYGAIKYKISGSVGECFVLFEETKKK